MANMSCFLVFYPTVTSQTVLGMMCSVVMDTCDRIEEAVEADGSASESLWGTLKLLFMRVVAVSDSALSTPVSVVMSKVLVLHRAVITAGEAYTAMHVFNLVKDLLKVHLLVSFTALCSSLIFSSL